MMCSSQWEEVPASQLKPRIGVSTSAALAVLLQGACHTAAQGPLHPAGADLLTPSVVLTPVQPWKRAVSQVHGRQLPLQLTCQGTAGAGVGTFFLPRASWIFITSLSGHTIKKNLYGWNYYIFLFIPALTSSSQPSSPALGLHHPIYLCP